MLEASLKVKANFPRRVLERYWKISILQEHSNKNILKMKTLLKLVRQKPSQHKNCHCVPVDVLNKDFLNFLRDRSHTLLIWDFKNKYDKFARFYTPNVQRL